MKNMMQKTLIALLVILMTFSVLTPAISAANTVKISEIWFGLYEPENGDRPDFRLTTSTGNYELTSFTWKDDQSGKLLTGDDKFEYQKSYTATLTFQPKDGYAFDTQSAFKVGFFHDYTTDRISPDQLTANKCTVHVTLVCTPGIIETVSLLLQIPHAGYRSSTELSHLSSYCTLAGFRWIDESTGKALADGAYFGEKGKRYTAELTLDAVEGYIFDDYSVHVFENSSFYDVTKDSSFPKRITARFSYLCTELVYIASATVTAPVAGAKPDYTVTFPDDAGYKLHPDFKSPVDWIEMNGNTEVRTLSADDKFEAGKKYRVKMWLAPKTENEYIWLSYTFINGNQGTWIRANGNSGGMAYVFTCEEAGEKYPLSVSIRSFLSETEPITVQLMQKGAVKYTGTCKGARATYEFSNVLKGSYTIRISKKNHVTRDYSVTVSGETTRSAKLCPIGDISGDGNVTAKDYAMANAHVQKVSALTDYALQCGDVLKSDGNITAADAARINAHVQKTDPLW